MSNLSSVGLMFLVVSVISLNLEIVICKPTIERSFPQHNFKTIIRSAQDLIALPTANAHQIAEQTPQNVQYVTDEQPSQVAQHQPQPEQQPQAQEVVYYMLPDGTTIEASEYIKRQQQEQHEPAKHYEHPESVKRAHAGESPSAEQLANGYPGEIVYANQNGELLRQVDGSYEPLANNNDKQEIHSRPSVELVTAEGKSLRESSTDLTATILTEIPLNDISQEVLEQLKKDYGAKVVATREYPGANLVINCADNSGLDVSLCSGHKQPPQLAAPTPTYQIQPEQETHIVVPHHESQYHHRHEHKAQHVLEYQPAHTTSGPEYITASPLEAEPEHETAEREHELAPIEHVHEGGHEPEKLIHHQPEVHEVHEEMHEVHQEYKQPQSYATPTTTTTTTAQLLHEEHHDQQYTNQPQYETQHEPEHRPEHQQYEVQQQHQQKPKQHHATTYRQENNNNNEYVQETTTTTYASQHESDQQNDNDERSTQDSRDSTTATTATTSTTGTTEIEQVASTSAYNVVEATSSASNSRSNNNETNDNERHAVAQRRSDSHATNIREVPDELSSISQEEEKIEK